MPLTEKAQRAISGRSKLNNVLVNVRQGPKPLLANVKSLHLKYDGYGFVHERREVETLSHTRPHPQADLQEGGFAALMQRNENVSTVGANPDALRRACTQPCTQAGLGNERVKHDVMWRADARMVLVTAAAAAGGIFRRYRTLPFRLLVSAMTATGRRAEPNTDEEAVRSILRSKSSINTLPGEAFVKRARSIAGQHNISWDVIASLPELAPTNLKTSTGEAATVELLNAISKTLQELSGKWPLIHWCTTGRGLAPGGDFKKSLVRPNYRASVVQNGTLTTPETAWQKLVSTGEYESEDSLQHGQQQMLHHLLEHLRYNPELREGFAILRLKSGSLRFASANACSIFVTRNQPAESADALIAYVVLVYDALHRRNASIELIDPLDPTDSAASTPPPTFTIHHRGASIDLIDPPAPTGSTASTRPSHIHQSSDNDDPCRSEQFFYKAAHAEDGGIPGLARVTAAWTDDTAVPAVPYDPTVLGPKRHLEVIILSCVGKRITFCKDVQQSLSVMHDTIDVSRRLALKHMMHRDFSEGNVLCDPKYEDGKQPTSPTCAEAVTDTLSPSPQCLVIDLDHAKLVEGGSTKQAKFEVTGTPLYMSSELLLDAGPISWLKGLVPTLEELLPPIPAILSNRFAQMFPEYKTFDALQAALQRTLNQTAKLFRNRKEVKRGDSPPIHAPRHDLESIFWVFSIFFASALPKGYARKPPQGTSFQSVSKIEAVLHPRLKELAPLLHKIASLLFCIPWCLLSAESTTTTLLPTTTATTATCSPFNMSTLAHDLVRYMLLAFLLDGCNSEILETALAKRSTRKAQAPVNMLRRACTARRKTGDSDQVSSSTQAQTGEDPPLIASPTDFPAARLATGVTQEVDAPAPMSRSSTGAVKRKNIESDQAPGRRMRSKELEARF
ncbi:hypothetical protein BKA62DRAFT_670739 [Auriculariales sp. MPI-PUGE-AT-0066]|nr:hypothetical protein BKA62DRAFT_670739 [Auriculariales sp. MPI-PUGE-AT-0066]